MARKTQSRLELRHQAEAAGDAGTRPKKAAKKRKVAKDATKKPTRRTKSKVSERKRLMWAVFNGSMKEEGRFPYDQRDAAEERIQQLKLKSPKKHLLHPGDQGNHHPAAEDRRGSRRQVSLANQANSNKNPRLLPGVFCCVCFKDCSGRRQASSRPGGSRSRRARRSARRRARRR